MAQLRSRGTLHMNNKDLICTTITYLQSAVFLSITEKKNLLHVDFVIYEATPNSMAGTESGPLDKVSNTGLCLELS